MFSITSLWKMQFLPMYIDFYPLCISTSLSPCVIPPRLDLIFHNLRSKVGYSAFSLQKSQNLKNFSYFL